MRNPPFTTFQVFDGRYREKPNFQRILRNFLDFSRFPTQN